MGEKQKYKSPTHELLSLIAEGGGSKLYPPSVQEWLGGRDIGDVFSPSAMGFTKQAAVKEVVGKFFDPNLPTQSKQFLRGAMADLLRVIGKTPKKATQHIGEFRLWPGSSTLGTYHPKLLSIYPSGKEVSGSMASSFAHEAGHGATLPMAGKVFKRHWGVEDVKKLPAEQVGMDLYTMQPSRQDPFEGVAEYIGRHIQKQAGLEPVPFFGHGSGQQRVVEELSKMPSKNPYMNVYRFLQKLITSSAGGE